MLDLLIVLAKRKNLILGTSLVAAILSIAGALLLPNIYTATTRILPPQQSQSSAAVMLQQLGGLASLAGGAAGLKSPSDMYIGMLRSRTIADGVIKRFDLNRVYEKKYISETRKELENETTIASGKDGIISIAVDDEDPKRAADIANAYVDELYSLTKNLAITETSQRRLFFEEQVKLARENLSISESKAKSAIDSGGLVKVDEQGRGLVETTARLRAQATVKEVQISAMRTYAAERNPQLLIAQQELSALKSELQKLESGPSQKTPDSNKVAASTGLDNLDLIRDVKYHESVLEFMAKQFEAAKIDEAKEPSFIQIIDKADVPDRKSKPPRFLLVVILTMLATIFAALWAVFREAIRNAVRDPANSERLSALKSYFP